VKLLEQLNVNAHSQAQWQVAQAHAKAKTCHRACLFPNADFADTKKTKSFKDSENGMTELKNYLKPLSDKNAQLVTSCIKHLADSANIKVITSNKHCSGLTGKCFKMPNVSYT